MKFLSLVLLAWVSSTHAYADVNFTAKYVESSNRFRILDCVTEWSNYCFDEGAYREAWIHRFGWPNTQDKQQFDKYKRIRKKYLGNLAEPEDPLLRKDGIFARGNAVEEDPFLYAFYSTNSQAEAYQRLESLLTRDELAWLKSFYTYFEPKTRFLLAESKGPFQEWATRLEKELGNPEYSRFFKKIGAFYGVSANINYELRITWWPPNGRMQASPTDRYLVFQKNPTLDMSASDLDVVFHEVVHTISMRQPKLQKQELTRQFLEACPISGRMDRPKILEEPLAVALGQIAFLAQFHPEDLDFKKSLYNDVWISAFGKTIYPTLKSELLLGHTIAQGFIPKAALQCDTLLKAFDQAQSGRTSRYP